MTITGIFQIKRQQIKGPRSRDSKKSGGVGTRASYIRTLGVEVEQAGMCQVPLILYTKLCILLRVLFIFYDV